MSATTLSQSSSLPSASSQRWHGALASPAVEFGPSQLKVLSGRIPNGLNGTFYQNGTGRLQWGAESVGHWFDGDGAILRVNFSGAIATGTYRYVQTDGYVQEKAANAFLYGNYGRRFPGPVWSHIVGLMTGKSIKNSANTSVLALADKLLALWEAGNPHSLDLETLETVGKDSLGWLKPAQPFSAHPLKDPISGEIYSIGVDPMCNLSIYRCNANAGLIRQTKIALKTVPLVHSFVMAGPYLVFLISPLKVDMLPLLLNQKCYADALQWQPAQGTRMITVDRASLEIISDERTAPWFQWHFGNGCVDKEGNVRLDFARFDDFTSINEVLREVPSGRVESVSYGRLWQLSVNPSTGKVLSSECVIEQDCEFPQVPQSQVGQPWKETYVLMHRKGVKTGEDWFGAIGKFDYETGALSTFELDEGCYGSEPLHVVDSHNPTQGWLLEVVYNAVEGRSEVWVLDAQHLGEAVCRLALPEVVPLGFHGTWRSR
ncbi:MAG: carotenoid oxygenase family protein [Cyanobacteria bacterium P01_D01_bin.36]